jgi:hypothetical protein
MKTNPKMNLIKNPIVWYSIDKAKTVSTQMKKYVKAQIFRTTSDDKTGTHVIMIAPNKVQISADPKMNESIQQIHNGLSKPFNAIHPCGSCAIGMVKINKQ